jgi:Ca-activated chloride channel family protein
LITGDHAMLSGYREKDLPFLLGYVMTEPKPTSQVLLAAETGDPLLAVGRYGLGTGMAYTSDLSEKWGAEWLAWDECGKFWAQVFRGIFRKASTRGLEVTETIDREQWEIQMLRRDPNRLPVNDIAWDVQATTALGKNIDVPVRQIGLGRYEASVSIRGHEKLSLRVHDTHDDLLKVLHYHRPYPREYALSGRVSQALEGGARYAEAGLRDGLRPLHTRQSVASWLYLGALALVLVGLLLRRV